MSSTRIAISSCALAVALAAGTWTAVGAFPLRGGAAEQQVMTGSGGVPPTAESYHIVATHYWEIVNKDTSLTPEQRLAAIAQGIAAEDRALAIDPNFVSALVYKNIFLRLQANLTPDPSQRERMLAEADELRRTAILLQRGTPTPAPDGTMPPPPPPPGSQMLFMPERFQRLVQELTPVRVGNGVPQPMKIRDVKPVYPPIAQESRVQGVVIVEALIGADGAVLEARLLRSIPLLDQAALDAVREWRFMPTTVDGQARAVLMTLTVNFTLQ